MRIAHDLITAEKHAGTVEELYLGDYGLVAMPDLIFEMPRLRVLDLSGNHLADADLRFSRMPRLKFLSLEKMGLRGLPAGLFTLEGLENLRISGNDLFHLPEGLAELQNLRVLEAARCGLKVWPDRLCTLGRLESLILSGNELTTLPAAVQGLRSLRYLNLTDNHVFHLPSGLALLPDLEWLGLENNRLEYGHSSGIAEDLGRFLKATTSGKLPPGRRQTFFEVLMNDLPALVSRQPDELLPALETSHSEVRQRAAEALYAALPDPFEEDAPPSVCLLGRMKNLGKTRATTQLQKWGIPLSSKPLSADCVVIAGERPGKRLADARAMGCRIGVEGHLEDFLAHREGKYLAAGKGSDNPMVQNIIQMLRSGRRDNVLLALGLMEGGGIPTDALSELMGLALFSLESGKLVGDFLEQHAPRRISRYLELARSLSETPVNNNLYEDEAVRLLMRHPHLDKVAGFRHALGNGFHGRSTYTFILSLPEPMQRSLMPSMLSEGNLSWLMLNLTRFPRVCLGYPGLKSLTLNRNELEELPPDIHLLSELEYLNLAENHLSGLPPAFYRLPRLKTLSLGQNRFHTVPAGLFRMPGLSSLTMAGNTLTGFPDPIPAETKVEHLNLTNCFRDGAPAVLAEIKTLDNLQLESCGIEELDSWRPGWKRMRVLSLANNPLRQVPEWVGELPFLQVLDLSDLPCRTLPGSLAGTKVYRLALPLARGLDWENIREIVTSLPSLGWLRYDRHSPPQEIRRLQRLCPRVEFKSYDPRK